jgi:hypothetical protein
MPFRRPLEGVAAGRDGITRLPTIRIRGFFRVGAFFPGRGWSGWMGFVAPWCMLWIQGCGRVGAGRREPAGHAKLQAGR